MSFGSRLIGRIRRMFNLTMKNASEAFGIDIIYSPKMYMAQSKWNSIITGIPPWLDAEDDIETVNLALLMCNTRARLTMLDIGIALSQSPRTEYMQNIADSLLTKVGEKLSRGLALGGMMIKYNGESWDIMYPGQFAVTDKDSNGTIQGAIFSVQKVQGDSVYTRLEWHRFEQSETDKIYRITNKVFKRSLNANDEQLGKPVKLNAVEAWKDIEPEVRISNLDKPLFAYFRVPGDNFIDDASPLGASAFAGALPELKAVDIAVSRKNAEVADSKHITFVSQIAIQSAQQKGTKLPRFIKGLGVGLNGSDDSAIHEHVPTMLTDQRIKDINFDLSLAGTKCGFSEGTFVMDGQTGMITATQVEADDRDTIQLIKDTRDALKLTLDQALYGADQIVTLYNLAPLGLYDIDYNFGDITYNYEEDKASWKQYVIQGWIPAWKYFVKFEGMSEEEAKTLVAEAQSLKKGLFEE